MTPVAPVEVNTKTGTSIVKSAPPKETARITVKPNLPASPPRIGNFQPGAKPAAGAVPVAAAAAVGAAVGAAAVAAKGSKPATTIVKTGTTKVTTPTVKTATAAGTPVAAGGVPVPAMQFQEEPSTALTTGIAAGCAVLTWGTAGVLFASLFGYI